MVLDVTLYMGTQKPTEGTGTQTLLLWSNKMAKVVYRGVAYDTETRVKSQIKSKKLVEETYRGVKHTELVEVAK